MENNDTCCLARILKVIDVLQKECTPECYQEGCDRPFLGSVEFLSYNTRPITLYSRNGSLFTVTYFIDNTPATSSVFRVEDVDGCCARLRILTPVTVDGVTTYTSTNEFVTVNLECFCIVRCLPDISIEI